MPNAAPNLEPEPEAPPEFDWEDVEWTAADYKRALAVLTEAGEITTALVGRFMADAHYNPDQLIWFNNAAGIAADAADAIPELGSRIDEILKLRPLKGSL